MPNIAQAQLFEMSSTATPTTTYPFTYTTFTNVSPSPFTKPTEFPSVFSFGSAVGCASNSVQSDTPAQPSNYPLGRSVGRSGGCVISNDAEYNDHAFWDMYACCESKDFSAMGKPFPCTAMCLAKGGQSFQDLGECLSKRVDVVICSPPFEEIGNATESDAASSSVASSLLPSSSASGSASGSGSVSGSASASASGSSSSAVSAGAASAVGRVQGSSSKAALAIFGIVAFGSAAGMFL
jgi:hypothetical protein